MALSSIYAVRYPFVALSFTVSLFVSVANAQQVSEGNRERAAEPSSPAEWYGAGVRPTEALSPADEQASFHLLDGYEIRLFAAEPEIAKPMNMAFDTKGRLWVTDSYEYPYPAASDATPRDCVRILDDTDGDGRADSSRVFADKLNIPIGVLPYGDGCLCFSIPNILYLRDTDGDGVCDDRQVVLGPFDTTRDTHGMINSMRMGSDGWVYANHGFNNQSRVAGRDGHEIFMQSGNTFRFRPDGSRVEQVTWGQVNPFGRASDTWGYDYAADCHSKPISQLISGGYYPSFGRPHDGLGFVPPMMDHLHGSTAIAGLIYVDEAIAGNEGTRLVGLGGQMLSGNVMTSRINRNEVYYVGATAKAKELGDFLTSDDPWFRPVDLQIGPDGFIYVADFYNKIIGHYEVPLEHPERDRFRGRIWQIRPIGTERGTSPFSTIDAGNVIASLEHKNPVVRSLAHQWLVEHASEQWDQDLVARLRNEPSERLKIAALWYLAQRQKLSGEILERMVRDVEAHVRLQALKVVAEEIRNGSLDMPKDQAEALVVESLEDMNPHVQRMAAEVLGVCGSSKAIKPLSEALLKLGTTNDVVLQQSLRIALRNRLRDGGEEVGEYLKSTIDSQNAELQAVLFPILMAIQNRHAGRWLIEYVRQNEQMTVDVIGGVLEHATRCFRGDSEGLDLVIAIARNRLQANPQQSWGMFALVASALKTESQVLPGAMSRWAGELVEQDLDFVQQALNRGESLAVGWSDEKSELWPKEQRTKRDGSIVAVNSSLPRGERYVGRFTSEVFPCPEAIEFWICGHNGYPDQVDKRANRVELVDVASQTVLMTAYPPRNDQMIPVRWETAPFAGRAVRMQVIDGDSGDAYAWVAVADFEPAWLSPQADAQQFQRALDAIARYRLTDYGLRLREVFEHPGLKMSQRAVVGATLAKLQDDFVMEGLYSSVPDLPATKQLPDSWVSRTIHGESIDSTEEYSALARQLRAEGQQRLALRLAGNRATTALLLELIDNGSVGADVLNDKNVLDTLSVSVDPDQEALVKRLVARAKSMDGATQEVLNEVLALLTEGKGTSFAGRGVFEKQCAVCHQLNGKGMVVGPQLDGVGGRGAARLLEDILMPDRNVDRAFRSVTVLTTDGQVKVGLPRAEKDGQIEFAGNDGKPFMVPKDAIEEMRTGANSLMPGNFHQSMQVEEIASLVRFLTESAAKNAEP